MSRSIFIAAISLALIIQPASGLGASASQSSEISQEEADQLNAKLDRAGELLRPYLFLSDVKHERANKKEIRQAIGLYDEVLARIPDHWTTLFFRGKAYQALGEHENAYKSLKSAFIQHKDHKDVLNEYAIEAMELGYFEEALTELKKGQQKFKDDIGVRGNYALALLMNGRVDASLEALFRIKETWPDDPITKKMIALVKNIQSKEAPLPTTIQELREM